MSFSHGEINRLARTEFVETLGLGVRTFGLGSGARVASSALRIVQHFRDRMNAKWKQHRMEEQLALLRAHPDLGTRAKISASSAANRQARDSTSSLPPNMHKLTQLNTAYRDKFGFPFLYAVKGSTNSAILEALKRRLKRIPGRGVCRSTAAGLSHRALPPRKLLHNK